MNTQKVLNTIIITALGILCTGSVGAASSTVYQQSFTGSGAMTDVNWSALAVRDFTGTNIDVSDYTAQAGRGSDYAFLAPHLASGSDPYKLRVAPGLFYTEAAEIQVDIGSLEQVAFDYIGDATDAAFRVAVKVGGQWYAQAVPTVDIRDNPGPNGGFLNASFAPADFAGEANWLTVSNGAVDAVEMTLGATPAQSLSGTVEAIGLYLENTSDHLRFDNFSVGAYVAPSVMISTTDGTGGVSGYIGYSEGGVFGGEQWHVKNPALGGVNDYTRKGYVRFDTSAIDFTATDVSLELTVSLESLFNSEIATIHVYGITDQSLDTVALDGSTTWANAPANNTASGDEPDLSQATLLGTFTYQGNEPVGTVKTFSSSAFIDFLNADTNGLVTFVLGRTDNGGANRNLLFAGDTHATYAPPKLRVTAEKPILTTRVGNGVSGYVRDNGTESFGGAAIAVKQGGSGFNRKGYLRFDLTSRESTVFNSASLKLVLDSLTGGTHTVAVYGLTDESLDDWDSSTVTYATAPANDASSGSAFLPLQSIYLGEIDLDAAVHSAGDLFTLSTPELTSFLNDDSNGLVTIMLGRTAGGNDHNPIFAGDFHATYAPPTLDLVEAPEGLYWIGFSFDSATGSNAVLSARVTDDATASTLVWDTEDRGTGSVDDWAYSYDTGAVSADGTAIGTATNLLPDTLYVARFFGTNDSYAGWSSAKSFSTALSPAQNPVISGAMLFSDRVELWWQDQAQFETGYVVERAVEGSGTYAVITELPANTVEYTDETVDSGVSYVYRLKAVNANNDSATEWVDATPSNGYIDWDAGYPATDLSDPDGDADLDGFSNQDEYFAGTNPTDPSDKPATTVEIAESVVLGKAWPANGGQFALWTEGERQYAVYYNADQRTAAAQRLLSETNWTEIILPSKVAYAPRVGVDESSTIASFDAHNDIEMALDSDGYIHVALNHHVNRLTYFRSTNAYDITTLVQVDTMVGDGSQQEDRVTYPKFMTAPTGELLIHYRHGNSGSGYEVYNIYNVTNQTWSRFLDEPMISGEGLRNAYQVGPTLGPDGWYHMGWVWRDSGDASTSHNPSYARSLDLINWETAAGDPLTLPITFGDTGTRIDPIPINGGIINGGLQLGFDSTNGFVATYHKFDEEGMTQIYAARFKEGAWDIHQISDWNYRWDFGGHGTLEFMLNIESARPVGNGELAMDYAHKKLGEGVLVFDEETLAPIRVEPPRPPAYPVTLDVLESTFPDMIVHFKEDSGVSPDPSAHYRLRWEAFGPGNDASRPVTDDPSDLILYRINSVDAPPYSYGEWLDENGLSGVQRERQADLEPDGLTNFEEYAFGGDPTNSDAAAIKPSISVSNGEVDLVFRRRTDDDWLTYRLWMDDDLVAQPGWTDIGTLYELGSSAVGDVPGIETVTNRIPSVGIPSRFFKLEVE